VEKNQKSISLTPWRSWRAKYIHTRNQHRTRETRCSGCYLVIRSSMLVTSIVSFYWRGRQFYFTSAHIELLLWGVAEDGTFRGSEQIFGSQTLKCLTLWLDWGLMQPARKMPMVTSATKRLWVLVTRLSCRRCRRSSVWDCSWQWIERS